jgi:HAMP domain-containing protein
MTTLAQQAIPGKKGTFVSVRIKLLIAFGLLFGIIYAVTFYWFLQFASQRAIDRLGEDLTVLIEAAADQINGDELKALYLEADPETLESDPRYIRHMEALETLKDIDPRATTYTIVAVNLPREYAMVTDAGQRRTPDNPVTAHFRDELILEEIPPGFPELFETERPASGDHVTYLLLEPYSDEYGQWVSGYTVIWDSEGQPVGILGADYDASFYETVRRDVATAAVPAFTITYIAVFSAVWALASLLARPIRTLGNMASRVGEGDYNQDFSKVSAGSFQDEINTLATVLSGMVEKVRTREETLKRQVAELKIEIDEVKQKSAVSEIVDSDFFKELQNKASEIRNRPRGGESRPKLEKLDKSDSETSG